MMKTSKNEMPRASEIQVLLKIHEALQRNLVKYREGNESRNKRKKKKDENKATDDENQREARVTYSKNSWQDIADYLDSASEEEYIQYPTSRSTIYEYLQRFEDEFEVPFEYRNSNVNLKELSEEQKKKIPKLYRYPKGFVNSALFDYIGSRLSAGDSNEFMQYLDAHPYDSFLGIWAKIYIKNLTRRDQLMKAVSFYENFGLVGENLEKFEFILNAILDKKPIEVHNKYDKRGQAKIQPYLLKNYNQRWYLIGKRWNEEPRPKHPDKYYEGYANIALNTIESSVSDTGENIPAYKYWDVPYLEPDEKELEDLFYDIVGVTTSAEGAQEVYLRFEKDRYKKYVATKPIVDSQHEVRATDPKFYDPQRPTIYLKVHITKELIQQILSFGPDCEVIYPPSLREEVAQQITTLYNLYHSTPSESPE